MAIVRPVLAGRASIITDLPRADDALGRNRAVGTIRRIPGVDRVDPAARLGASFRQQFGRELGCYRIVSFSA